VLYFPLVDQKAAVVLHFDLADGLECLLAWSELELVKVTSDLQPLLSAFLGPLHYQNE
jgi:hypothetical protein